MSYVFHCTPCGFEHAGECVPTIKRGNKVYSGASAKLVINGKTIAPFGPRITLNCQTWADHEWENLDPISPVDLMVDLRCRKCARERRAGMATYAAMVRDGLVVNHKPVDTDPGP